MVVRSRSPVRKDGESLATDSVDDNAASSGGAMAIDPVDVPIGGMSAADGDPGGIHKAIKVAFDSHQVSLLKEVSATAADAATGVMVGVQAHLGRLDAKVANLQTQNAEILEKITAMQKHMHGMSHSASAPALPSGGGGAFGGPPVSEAPNVTNQGFWRRPDPKILYCNTMAGIKVSLSGFYKSVVKLCKDVNVGEEDYDVTGDQLDDRFEIRFTSASANAQALQLFQSIFLGRGKFKPLEVNAPDDSTVKFFINPDKNAATVKKEVLCKRLTDIIASTTATPCFARKSTGSVVALRKVLATVVVASEENVRIVWFQPLALELKLNIPEIEEQFKGAAGVGQLG